MTSDDLNEDWLRTRSLDLFYDGHEPRNLHELQRCLPSSMSVDKFMALPASRALPIKIHLEWHKRRRAGMQAPSEA